MTENKEPFNDFLNGAVQAADLIRKHAENNELIHVVPPLDADGLAAAGIMGRALTRLGATFRIRIERWVDEKVLDSILAGKPSLIVFTDFGSGDLDQLNSKLSKTPVVILDHHQPVGEAGPSFVQVNPHLYGIDGSRDLSGAGVAYFVAKALDKANLDTAAVAVGGALGGLQDKHDKKRLGGPNAGFLEKRVKV